MSVCLVEYKNYINEEKVPVGHGLKYIKEIDSLLGNNTTVACSQDYKISDNELRLPYSCSNKYDNRIEKIKNIIKKCFNIIVALLKSKDDIIWFTNVDWILFFVLGILPIHKKIIITAYTSKEKLRSKCPITIFNRAFPKIDLIVKTNSNLEYGDCSIFVPDFYYSTKYKDYHKDFDAKKNAVLIVGTIREEKDIIGAVGVLNSLGCEALICGKFYDEGVFRECIKIANDNIKIENKILPEEEYYRLIASYKFVFLPYKNDYKTATSGVLLETIFLDSIPIAPRFLLQFNRIAGIGYEKIEEIPTMFIDNNINSILLENKKNICEYNYNKVKKMIEENIKILETDI